MAWEGKVLAIVAEGSPCPDARSRTLKGDEEEEDFATMSDF
eukprot:CAMPEP_0176500080 /NCGR_PEP_ID=MMETSP0200_2-20121128/13318_1 /TAXON_ID=947934 /ORGANISM="Chaetoceros sp., Strain GSL56" /LENGTH=40 /DNA_ID= /DNA_START= /DNA_END= /DNA_ORIENTATION=